MDAILLPFGSLKKLDTYKAFFYRLYNIDLCSRPRMRFAFIQFNRTISLFNDD
jgi:hypothetical protein